MRTIYETIMTKKITAIACAVLLCHAAHAQKIPQNAGPEYYKTAEAQQIGNNILAHQRETGGWPKNTDMCRKLTPNQLDSVASEMCLNDATIDNGATITQMRFLAGLYAATDESVYREHFVRGLRYILQGQYGNGGWPQSWPNAKGYHMHITYNDDAMANVMEMLLKIINNEYPYTGICDPEQTRMCAKAFNKGVSCILKTQIKSTHTPSGRKGLTIWCQQHHEHTLQPAPARAFEPAAYASTESAGIARLLMMIPNPGKKVIKSVTAAMQWFDNYKITGYTYTRETQPDGGRLSELKATPEARTPIWGRFYDLDSCRVFVCGRDGIPRRSLNEIEPERRNGYAWYSARPVQLFEIYEEWKKKNNIR